MIQRFGRVINMIREGDDIYFRNAREGKDWKSSE